MKKQLKKLSLSKKVVANFEDIHGGRPPKSHYKKECEGPEPVSASCFIESNCIGCTVDTVSG